MWNGQLLVQSSWLSSTALLLVLLSSWYAPITVYAEDQNQAAEEAVYGYQQDVVYGKQCAVNDETFGALDVSIITNNQDNWYDGIILQLQCNTKYMHEAPLSIHWHIKAVSDDNDLQIFTYPSDFIKPKIIKSSSKLGFEWVPPTNSTNNNNNNPIYTSDELKEAGVEILIPQSKFTSLDINRDFDSILVNLLNSQVESFNVTLLSGENTLLIESDSYSNVGPEIYLNNTGVTNNIKIISSTAGAQITSDGSSNIELYGDLTDGSSLVGYSDTLWVQGDITGSVTSEGALNNIYVLPYYYDESDPCSYVTDVGYENTCQKSNDFYFNFTNFDDYECKSSNEELTYGSCVWGEFKFGWKNTLNNPFDNYNGYNPFNNNNNGGSSSTIAVMDIMALIVVICILGFIVKCIIDRRRSKESMNNTTNASPLMDESSETNESKATQSVMV